VRQQSNAVEQGIAVRIRLRNVLRKPERKFDMLVQISSNLILNVLTATDTMKMIRKLLSLPEHMSKGRLKLEVLLKVSLKKETQLLWASFAMNKIMMFASSQHQSI